MNNLKNKPAIQRACAFIKNSLENRGSKKGECLPSIRDMARLAQVSPRSMIKAVATLKQEGVIHGSERARLRIGPEAEQPAIKPSTGWEDPVWLKKRTALEQDVLEGVWARDTNLPAIKELCIRYGACFTTMRKALGSMVDDGVVQLYRGKYRLPHVKSRPYHRRVVFISYRIQAVQWSALNQGQYRVLDLLEGECARQQLKLEVIQANLDDAAETHRAIARTTASVPAVGYFLDALWTIDKEHNQWLMDLLIYLAAAHLPVAILDENGTFDLPIQFVKNPLLQVFRIQGEHAGGQIARLLLGLGHRSVAYISWQHSQSYSVQRLSGIKKQFALAGYSDNVHAILNQSMDEFFKFLAISGFDEELIRRIIAIDRNSKEAEETIHQFLQYKQNPSPLMFNPAYIPVLQKKVGCIASLYRQKTDKQYFDAMVGTAVHEATEEFSALICQGMFEQAVAYPEVTAWICATDGLAGMALKYLNGAGISVPGEISVAGFDNMPVVALERRLTSFDFNAAGFVHRMINYILRPPRAGKMYCHSPIEVEGIVMQRDTTASAKKD